MGGIAPCARRRVVPAGRRPRRRSAERRATGITYSCIAHRSSLIARAGAARCKLGFMRSIRVPAWRIDGRNDE
ncbi:hypothetical protein BURPS1106A_A1007 [Burkholderia pseudomallei 1106a]|uniref:Uncharacterized protein n=1 Tax=Burkholderia pseudomallei (strain 1106a) TaxID=357348 RepID=A3P3Y3_BURP0|nr:hypothetical protein BURPS1106A_A1007 [Burkholderia pseudomallei 1106a]